MPTASSSGDLSTFDPFDPSPDRDPHPTLAWLRREAPVWEHRPGVYLVTRYHDVRRVLLDHHTFSNRGNFSLGGDDAPVEPPNITHMDPPDHTVLRRVLAGGFSTKAMREAAPWVERRAAELIDAFRGDASADLAQQYALALTTSIIGTLVGLPPDDAHRVIAWSHDVVKQRPAPVADMASFRAMFEYLTTLLAERRRMSDPPDDMITRLIERPGCPADPELDDLQLVTHVYQLMAAGFPTTAYTIQIALWQLLSNRPLWEAVVRDPGLVSAARDEALRFGSAIRAVFRTADVDAEVGDTAIPAGSRVVLSLESANRDEEIYDDPDSFLLSRGAAPQLAFGWGIHLCVGATLARTEIDVAIATLAERLPDVRLTPGFAPRWEPIGLLNGLQAVPVVF